MNDATSSSSICVTLSYIPYLPFTKRAALRCTISNLSELYFWWGCQTVALYSRKDRTIVLFTVTSLNYVARPPGPYDPNLDQNYDIFVGTILAFNANVLHAPNRVRSEIRKDPSVTLFFGRTSLSNRNIVLAILLLAGDVHPNPGPINRGSTIYPCGYCQQHVGWSCSGVGCETCNVWYHRECVSITHSHYLALNNSAHVWICFMCQTPNFSNSSISITGSPEINFNSPNSFAVLSDLTGKDDVFLRSPLATLFNPPLFSTPTGDTSSFSNFRYTLSSSGMSNSTSSIISNSQIKKSQSWRTLVVNINIAPGKRAELENLINYTDPDLIIMTETKIDEQVKASEFLPKGYTGDIRKDRCAGGVMIATKQGVPQGTVLGPILFLYI